METKVTECALSPEIESALMHPHGGEVLPLLIQEVRDGIAQLWRISREGKTVYVITRIERDAIKTELVITWAVGNAGKYAAESLQQLARRKGWILRVHCDATRMRLFRRYGFVCDEYVMRFK